MRRQLQTFVITTFLLVLGTAPLHAQTYLDPNATVDARVADLLSRMTLAEKVGQMTQADHSAVGNLQDVQTYYLGSILSGGGSDPAAGNAAVQWADLYDSFQTQALQTRLQIPVIYGIDAVHGHSNVFGAVIFPHNIGLGATRNAALVEQAGRITAIEMAATGIDWTFAPCIAVPRDERWGRTYEGFGETPELAELLGGAAVRGLQNDPLNSPTSIAACAKHYIGDGGTLFGVDQGNTVVSEAELRAIHLPGYVEAVANDVKTIMASYSSWNGIKLHGHSYLLNDVLKGELGFEGFVISDWAGIDQLPGDYVSDVQNSVNAGVDMVMVPHNYSGFFNTLVSLVGSGGVSMARIDDAVARILRVKFELGLFENPLADRSGLPLVGSAAHRAVAQQCVQESQVLLRKDDAVLPLPDQGIKVLVAGDHANNIGLQCGGWTIEWGGASGEITPGTTILEGLQQVAPNVEFVYNAAGDFTDTNADYIIAVIGEQPYVESMGDASDLTVQDAQIRMIRNLKRHGLPVITLLVSGRPMLIQHVLHNSDVFIASWLPGTEADGIAEVIFGQQAPTGLLPMTWPRSMAQIPINVGDSTYDPLFAYGFGITDLSDSAPGSRPVLNSAMLIEDGAHVELAFNKSMNNIGNSTAQFTVIRNNANPIGVVGFEISPLGDNIVLLELAEASQENDVLSISYDAGDLQSADGGTLATFSGETVINILPYASGGSVIPGRVEAEDFYIMSGIQTEATSDVGGGQNVGWIEAGDWLEFEVLTTTAGTYDITFRTACLAAPGRINFLVDGGELFSINVPVTGGWQNWVSVSAQAFLPQGYSRMRIHAEQGGFNLNWFEANLTVSGVGNTPTRSLGLVQNYPNPFNPQTTISFDLPTQMTANLHVFDISGRLVAVLMDDETAQQGRNEVIWRGTDLDGRSLPSGTFFYRLEAGGLVETRRMTLLK
ncbi:MAG: glycoside hydrolase family 3 N-terminal domain-containing protein [Candidatus Krumholzibacteria bacterium]|nr:glycoside hydrolase family 3 N-terminal domain-containing protein [Candidatus Krumholzibacteria bacterium]